tara:strand:- start:2784 stop:3689 length:906 start_codon:yes stop_codon:yes gene_type:complete
MPFTEYFCDGFDCSASVVIASLYNTFTDAQAMTPSVVDNSQCVLELDPILLDMDEFRELFYPSGSGSFALNGGLRGAGVTSFNEQTLTDQDGTHEFNLMDFILSCYESELNIQRNSIAPLHMIELQKDLARYMTMFDIRGSTYGLKWTEVVSVLEQVGALKHPDEAILFKVAFNYVNASFEKTRPVTVMFNYKVVNMFPNYSQFRHGLPKQKIHPRNPLRISPQFIKRADGTIVGSGNAFPHARAQYSILNSSEGFGQRVVDRTSQDSQLMLQFRRQQRKEDLDEMLAAMLEEPSPNDPFC